MLIVVEGVDLVGKTTLSRRFAARLGGAGVVHAGFPKGHPLDEYERPLADYDPCGTYHVVLDRWHLGEQVWPTIFGRPTELDEAVARHLELFMRSRGAVYVYGVRDPDLLAPELVRHDEPLQPERLREALDLFEGTLEQAACPVHLWDYTSCGEDTVLTVLADARVEAAEVCHLFRLTAGEWVGTPYPSVLLVGDRFGTDWDLGVPFVPRPRAACGHYLMAALPEWWREVAVVNAHRGRTDEGQPLADVWAALHHPNVVALGEHAAARLEMWDVPYEKVPHPQYWRRFHHHARDMYTEQLKRAAGG